jgi:hypothetical protein
MAALRQWVSSLRDVEALRASAHMSAGAHINLDH